MKTQPTLQRQSSKQFLRRLRTMDVLPDSNSQTEEKISIQNVQRRCTDLASNNGHLPVAWKSVICEPCQSAACWRESPLLRSFEVKNSELWLQMGPASAVCGELGLPSLERETARLGTDKRMTGNDRNDKLQVGPKIKK